MALDIRIEQLCVEIWEVFCTAMLEGGRPSQTPRIFECFQDGVKYRKTCFTQGPYCVVDCWHVVDQHFYGRVVVCRNKQPVWVLNYQGWSKAGEDFINEVLCSAYQSRAFHGTRGPINFACDGWTYKNCPYINREKIDNFVCEDSLTHNGTGMRCAEGRYEGMLIISH